MTSSTPPWAAEHEVTLDLATRLISNQFPELLPLQIQLKGSGWDNVVFQVNLKYLFRFPRRHISIDLLKNEARILPKIRHRLPLAIPELIYQGQPEIDYPWPFLGYRFLDGMTACQVHLNATEREQLAPILGNFLHQLHQISAIEAQALGAVPDQLKRLDILHRLPSVLDYIRRLKNLHLIDQVDALQMIIDQSQTFANTHATQNTSSMTLLHGDLYIRHLLIGSNRELSGIIDWGDVHYGNPALDLSVIFTVLPPHAHTLFYKTYGTISKETWMLARFRGLVSTFMTTVYAHSINDSDLLQEGLLSLEYLSQHTQYQ